MVKVTRVKVVGQGQNITFLFSTYLQRSRLQGSRSKVARVKVIGQGHSIKVKVFDSFLPHFYPIDATCGCYHFNSCIHLIM